MDLNELLVTDAELNIVDDGTWVAPALSGATQVPSSTMLSSASVTNNSFKSIVIHLSSGGSKNDLYLRTYSFAVNGRIITI